MKKSVLIVAAVLAANASFAQDLTSKKGEKILPEANDWAIGLSAHPIISSLGSIMNPGAAGTISSPFGATTIMGKKFKDDKTAYRAMVGLGFGSTSTTDADGDETKVSTTGVTIGGGLEKRRGNTRLQGYYGGMASLSFGSKSTTITYKDAAASAGQPNSNKEGATFGLNVSGLVGAEYFVLPKISIGAEYWWGISFNSTGEGETTFQGGTPAAVKTPGASSFNLGGSYGSGQLFVNFHF